MRRQISSASPIRTKQTAVIGFIGRLTQGQARRDADVQRPTDEHEATNDYSRDTGTLSKPATVLNRAGLRLTHRSASSIPALSADSGARLGTW